MRRFIKELTQPAFSLLTALVLVIYSSFAYGDHPVFFSLRTLIAVVILVPVMIAAFLAEQLLRRVAGLPFTLPRLRRKRVTHP